MSSFKDLRSAKQSRQHTRIRRGDLNHQDSENQAGPSRPKPQSDDKRHILEIINNDVYGLPVGIECRKTDNRGRGIYATQAYKPGNRIFSVKPTVTAISSSCLSLYCSRCGLSPPDISIQSNEVDQPKGLKRCVGCRLVYYCSIECQKSDWTNHQDECVAHKRLRAIYTEKSGNEDNGKWRMSEAVRALGRLCWARKRSRSDGKRDSPWWTAVEIMESHVQRLPEKKVMELANQVQHLRQYLSASNSSSNEASLANMEDYGFTSSSQLLNLFSAFMVNSFALQSPSLSPIGVATSPAVALFNHSCHPNAVIVFPAGAKSMEVIAIGEISPGEEILTSYIDVSLPQQDRQDDLRERYGFECDCSLCSKSTNEAWVDPRWSVLHQGCRKGKGVARMPNFTSDRMDQDITCRACQGKFAVDGARLRKLVEKGKEILSKDERGTLDAQEGLKATRSLIPALLTMLPASSHPVLALLRLHSLLLTPPSDQAALNEAVSSLAKAYAGLELVHPVNHPTLAVVLAEWGKLLAMELPEGATVEQTVKRLMEAMIVLRKVYTACQMAFGPGGGIVGMEVWGLTRSCEGEINLIRSTR